MRGNDRISVDAESTNRIDQPRRAWNRRARLASTGSLLVVIGACATARSEGGASPLLSADWQPPSPNQRCFLMPSPRDLPPAEQVLDLAAAQRALEGTAQMPGAYAVLEAHFDSAGARSDVMIVENTLESDVAVKLTETIAARVPAAVEPDGEEWGVLIRAAAGSTAEPFTIGRMEYCPVAIASASLVNYDAISLIETGLNGSIHVAIQLRLDGAGVIREARLRGSTGSNAFDQYLISLTDRMQIAPPLLNRRPLDGWSSIPLSLRVTERTPGTKNVQIVLGGGDGPR